MGFISFIVFSLMLIAAGINGGMPIPTLIGILVICFFGWWRISIRENSGIDKIFKPIPEDPQKSKSVVITSDGEIIRTLEDDSVESTSNIDKINIGEDNIMWDFKLKKTRIILIISILWFFTSYLFIGTEGRDDWSIDNVMTRPGLYIMLLPLFIYWIAIPLYRFTTSWVMKGK